VRGVKKKGVKINNERNRNFLKKLVEMPGLEPGCEATLY
jgi:hypothetical protein